MCEAGAGVVNPPFGNEGIGSAEPPKVRRRQHLGRRTVDEVQGLPGVIGPACGEGRSEEGGRSREVSGGEANLERPSGRRATIRENLETVPRASWEVGGERGSEESAVMAEERRRPTSGTRHEGNGTAQGHRKV
jgi:hypothetical protein